MSHYQAPEPSTPLTSPVGILVPTPAGPQALFAMARSHNPGVPFQSILAEEFTAGMLFTCIFGPSQSFGSQEHTDCDISSASLTCLESMQEPRLYTMCLRPSVTPSRLGLSSGNPERRWKHSSPAAARWQPGAPANCCAGSGRKLALCRSRTAIPGGLLVKRSLAGSPRTACKVIIPTAINKLYHTTDLGKDLKTIWIWILACLALGVSHFPNPPLQLLWGNCVLGLGRVLWLLWGLLQGSAPDAPGLMAEVGLGLQFAGQRFAGQWGS